MVTGQPHAKLSRIMLRCGDIFSRNCASQNNHHTNPDIVILLHGSKLELRGKKPFVYLTFCKQSVSFRQR